MRSRLLDLMRSNIILSPAGIGGNVSSTLTKKRHYKLGGAEFERRGHLKAMRVKHEDVTELLWAKCRILGWSLTHAGN